MTDAEILSLSRATRETKALLLYDWSRWARPEQIAPEGDWRTWLYLAGRGAGKTRTGAEWVQAIAASGSETTRIALVAPTAADARDVMVEGQSGILRIARPDQRPKYEPSRRQLTWPSGATALTFSAEEPDRLRGPQFTAAWADELAAWRRMRETWDMLMFGLRLGANPQCFVSTTPRPVPLLKEILADLATVVTRGSTYANAANLAPQFLTAILKRYEGTRLGQQEIQGLILDEVDGAYWSRDLIESTRVSKANVPELRRIVVAIDPAVSANETSDETGIIVAGIAPEGHTYVIEDRSGRMKPIEWARTALRLYRDHKADRIIGEVNNGGNMIEHTLRSAEVDGIAGRTVPYKAVHASKGKAARAEPIAALFEQNRAHIVGTLDQLEAQLCSWEPLGDERSPDRLDAMVWALTELTEPPRRVPSVTWI